MPKTFNYKEFDKQVYDLACWILDECYGVNEAKRKELASRIQQTIDDYGEELMDGVDDED